MALYSYRYRPNTTKRKVLTLISYISILAGCLFLFWSFYPVIAFEIYANVFIKRVYNDPVSKSKTASLVKAETISGTGDVFSTNLVDYTKASFWFPEVSGVTTDQTTQNLTAKNLDKYSIDIPKINISNAIVNIGSEDLLKGLVHYLPRGSIESLPGEYGHIPVFGHSTLPQLHKKCNDGKCDYKSVFTYLPTITKGDKIFLKANGLTYEYSVYDIVIVKPDAISVLEQRYDNAYLSLITCVPLGTYWNRLVVRAKLTQLPQ